MLLAGAGTPLLILAPVFAGGLFTDYAIHMGYHAGWRGDGSGRAARGYLRLPLALTAATTVIGFLALGGLGSTVHRFVAVTVSAGALAALALALWWMPVAGRLRVSRQRNAAGLLGRRIHRLLVGVLLALSRHRVPATVLLALPVVVAAPQVGRLAPEPYPLHQLPAASTIVQAEGIFNREFAGTVPFAVAIDAGTANAFLRPEAMQHLRAAHRILGELPAVGHRHSLLTVVERIHRYFAAGEADARELPASDDPERFARIVSQYLLFYSASATPADYAALADGSLSAVQVHGILRYRDFATLGELQRAVAGDPGGAAARVAHCHRRTGPRADRARRAAAAQLAELPGGERRADLRDRAGGVPQPARGAAQPGPRGGGAGRGHRPGSRLRGAHRRLHRDRAGHHPGADGGLHHPRAERPAPHHPGRKGEPRRRRGGHRSACPGCRKNRDRPATRRPATRRRTTRHRAARRRATCHRTTCHRGNPPPDNPPPGNPQPGQAQPRVAAVGRAAAVVRGCGVPMFMSFLTSVVAFLSLAVSSFSGAVHFGIMIAAAILGALLLSLLIAGWQLARHGGCMILVNRGAAGRTGGGVPVGGPGRGRGRGPRRRARRARQH